LEQIGGARMFELAVSVTVCPGVFGRTKMITLLPRYQIVNLLHRWIVVAQDACLDDTTVLPSKSAVPFHWTKGSLEPKIRIGAPIHQGVLDSQCWSRGSFRLDRVGITAMRVPSANSLSSNPLVVQVEVRLASKDQSSAVVVVIWSANEKSNPLYVLRNSTPFTILCRQPLQDDQTGRVRSRSGGRDSRKLQAAGSPRSGLECGAELPPMIRSLFGPRNVNEFVWSLKSGEVTYFGFEDPEKPHIIEWTCVEDSESIFREDQERTSIELDCMGSSAWLRLPDGRHARCEVGAEKSAKMIEFFLMDRGNLKHQRKLAIKSGSADDADIEGMEDDVDDTALGLRLEIPILSISFIDNANPSAEGREISFSQFDRIFFAFSQTREGYHEIEWRVGGFQTDNHVKHSIHPVLVSSTAPH
jgi:hypothetical protein